MVSVREAFGKLGKILYGVGQLVYKNWIGVASKGIGIGVHGYELARGIYDRNSQKYFSAIANLFAFIYTPALYVLGYVASLGYDLYTGGSSYLSP